MKKLLLAPLLVVGACAACCALPLSPALWAGLLTLAGGAGAAMGQRTAALSLAVGAGLVLALVLIRIWRAREARPRASAVCQVTCNTQPGAGHCACPPKQADGASGPF